MLFFFLRFFRLERREIVVCSYAQDFTGIHGCIGMYVSECSSGSHFSVLCIEILRVFCTALSFFSFSLCHVFVSVLLDVTTVVVFEF